MRNIAIVEDDDRAAETLAEMLQRYCAETGGTEEFRTVRFADGILFLQGYSPDYDIVFMDIEMPDLDGMRTAKKLRESDADGQLRTPNIDRLDVRFAEAVANPCTAIDITIQPKTAYVEGEKFDPTGIVFDATYDDGTEKTGLTVADIDEWTLTRALRTDDTTVTIKHDGFEKTIDITVSEKKVTNVEIVSEPVIKSFPKGGTIDLGGLKVNATYEGDAAPVEETEYTVKDSQGKTYVDGETVLDTAGELTLTVSVTSGGGTVPVKEKKKFFVSKRQKELDELGAKHDPLSEANERLRRELEEKNGTMKDDSDSGVK